MKIDEQLKGMDPAAGRIGDGNRAAANLQRVMSTEPGAQRTRKSRKGRYTLAAGLAGVGVVVAPVLGGSTAAFAGWDEKPVAASPEEAKFWSDKCDAIVGGPDLEGIDRDFRTVLVELRGDWSFTVMQAADGMEIACLADGKITAERPEGDGLSWGGEALGEPAADSLLTGSVVKADILVDGTQYAVTGRIGSDVAGVAFLVGGREVEATIENGRFAAWWPEPDPASLLGKISDRVHKGPPNPDVRITLRDGTSRVQAIQDFDVSPM